MHQTGHEIKPYGHLVRMPISLAESACKESVDNLNQLLADTMTLRDTHKTSLAGVRADSGRSRMCEAVSDSLRCRVPKEVFVGPA